MCNISKKSVNNNNNNSFNSNNEKLFWDVFHNKYLFNYIINCIEIIELPILDDKNQVFRPMKFKEIKSFSSMIRNKQYELLKCKIKAGENIEIDRITLNTLFLFGKNQQQQQQQPQPQPQQQNEIIIDIGERNQKLEIFQILLNYKFNDLFKFDLYKLLIGNYEDDGFYRSGNKNTENIKAIKILNNEIYNYPITSNHLIQAIKYSTPLVVDTIINLNQTNSNNNNNNLISEHIKNNSIKFAFENEIDNEKMIEYILNNNNNQLYNIPSDTSSTTNNNNNNDEHKKKRVKYDKGQKEKENINKLEAHSILFIKSKEIKMKLLKLNYFKAIDQDSIKNTFCGKNIYGGKNLTSTGTDLEIINDTLNRIYDQDYDDGNNDEKHLDFTIKECKCCKDKKYSIQLNYLLTYDKPFKGINEGLIYKYGLVSFNYNLLNHFLKQTKRKPLNDDSELNIMFTKQNSKHPYISRRTFEEMIQFIKIYTENYQYFKDEDCDSNLKRYISLTEKTDQQYKQIYDSISKECKVLKEYIPVNSKWNSILYYIESDKEEKVQVKDKDSIDWIIENKSHFHKDDLSKLQFTSIELLEYALEKQLISNSLNEFIFQFEPLYINTINNCDIELLKSTIKLLKDNGYEFTDIYFEIEDVKFKKGLLIEDLVSFLNYSNQVSVFLNGFFIELVDKVISEYIGSSDDDEQSITALSKLEFNKFPKEETIKLFSRLLSDISSINIIKLFIKDATTTTTSNDDNVSCGIGIFNPMKNDGDLFLKYWNHYTDSRLDKSYGYNTYDSDIGILNYRHRALFFMVAKLTGIEGPFYLTSNESPTLIISYIQMLLNQFNIENRNNNKDDEYDLTYFKSISNVINHLYKRLIKCKKTTIEDVKFIRNLIVNNFKKKSFRFEHSLFHSFYYILIKSRRLIMFIMELQKLDEDYQSVHDGNDIDYGSYINYKDDVIDYGDDNGSNEQIKKVKGSDEFENEEDEEDEEEEEGDNNEDDEIDEDEEIDEKNENDEEDEDDEEMEDSNVEGEVEEENEENLKDGVINFIRLIDPKVFTFEYLHGDNTIKTSGASFVSILESLINGLIYIPAIKYTIEYHDEALDLVLNYLLDLKCHNLFFKQLELIQQQQQQQQQLCKNKKAINFTYSFRLFERALREFGTESFKKFAEFNSYSYSNVLANYLYDKHFDAKLLEKHSDIIEEIKLRSPHHHE